ncbi:MAG: hypothetical protein H2172_04120 [Opitutus sp.]|nr:hypothetical protein [Opitutus sp.]MCS6247760.1 hypothetical protein [Opitutus sp.]MCS6274240.1 hypothetical protein [Opitutus sp.]MCS6278003.1 hypothetical protein [Opitutus sp.]MCS6298889.1 hypothetical protein [Opitutus sp.]
MKRIKIGLRDKMFAHAKTAGSGVLDFPNLPFEWDRSSAVSPLTVYTDENVADAVALESQTKVAWLYESPEVTRKAYKYITSNPGKFNRILTFNQPILEKFPHARFTPIGGCWLHEKDWTLPEKKRTLSIIASAKKSLPGHKLRHTVINNHKPQIDFIAGNGYKPISLKIEALRDFRYSICIENCRQNFYFSEKLIDCFLTGTIPIYWGCPGIGLFFNLDGLITFEHPYQLEKILAGLSALDYDQRLSAIKDNFERAKRYVYVEEHIWRNVNSLISE